MLYRHAGRVRPPRGFGQRRYLAALAEDQQRVDGWSLVRLYKGAVLPVARWSPATLYDPGLAAFTDRTGAGFDPRPARGFIDGQALHPWAAERARHVGEEQSS
jgi:argininosuccinate synthase